VFCNFWLRKWDLFRNYLRMDFVNTFYNTDKLRNGIITNAIYKILENVFTSCFPAILNKYTFGTSSREKFYLFHEMTGSVEAVKSSFLNVRMKDYAFKCTRIALQQFSRTKLNPTPCQFDSGMSC